MSKSKFILDNSYNLPYTSERLGELWEEARKDLLLELLSKTSGEVINGVLTGVIHKSYLQELLNASKEEDSN